MTERYAVLDRNKKVRRVVTGVKPTEKALPVEYPDKSSVDSTTKSIKQNPISQWEVLADRVRVTYTIKDRDIEKIRKQKIEELETYREWVESDGTYFESEDGDKLRVRSDAKTQSKIAAAIEHMRQVKEHSTSSKGTFGGLFKPSNTEEPTISWKRAPSEWSEVNQNQLEMMARAIGQHVQKCFKKQFELEKALKEAESIKEIEEIDIYSDWPETAGLSNHDSPS